MKLFAFGEKIPGLTINGQEITVPVLNERDARAAAGLMLVSGFVAFSNAFFLGDFS